MLVVAVVADADRAPADATAREIARVIAIVRALEALCGGCVCV